MYKDLVNLRTRNSTFDWFYEQQHTIILGVLWELVVNSNADVKVSAAVHLKSTGNHLFVSVLDLQDVDAVA